MNAAVFFQKNRSTFWGKFFPLYKQLFLRSNQKRVKYLRAAGAKIGEGCHIPSIGILETEPWLVEIGNSVFFAGAETHIITHDGSIAQCYQMGIAPKRYDVFGKVKIGNNCFIGSRCLILRGVTIGDNCIIGAGSVVTKDIPSGSVACGVPARVVRTTQEYYEKNKNQLHDTVGWNTYKKREYLQKYFAEEEQNTPQ